MSRNSKRRKRAAVRAAKQQLESNGVARGQASVGQPSNFVVTPTQPPPVGVRATHVTTFAAYSGPIPPPDMLQAFEDVTPGAAKLILENFDRQSRHRQGLETRHQTHSHTRSWGGLAVGAVMGIGSLMLAGYMAHLGQPLVSLGTFIFAVSALCGTFVYGRKSQMSELRAKKSPPAKP